MAKAKGESKQGLIITLIFFILTTIILGVTTYLGFDGQAEFKKQADEANKKAAAWEKDHDWQKLLAIATRAYDGNMLAKDAEDLAPLYEKFDALKGASRDKSKEDAAKLVKETFEKELGWDPANKKPKDTHVDQIKALKKQLGDTQKTIAGFQAAQKKAEDDAVAAQAEAKKARDEYTAKVKSINDTILKNRADDQAMIEGLQAQVKALGEASEAVKAEMAKLNEDTQKKVAALNKIITDQRLKLEKAEAAVQVVNVLDFDRPKGKIVAINRSGENVFINLGSADNVKPQLTFGVYGVDANGKPVSHVVLDEKGRPDIDTDGKPIKEGKGSIEVVRVISEHLSEARVTGLRDGAGDPIVKNDLLFNPGWDPSQRQHVAVAGTVDLTGEGTDNLGEFLRTLERQNVVVDAYLDLKDITEKGKGITRQTEFMILGGTPDSEAILKDADPRAKRRDAVIEAMTKMQQKALENGVQIISLRKYLMMSGFRLPRTDNSLGAKLHPTVPAAGSPVERKPPFGGGK